MIFLSSFNRNKIQLLIFIICSSLLLGGCIGKSTKLKQTVVSEKGSLNICIPMPRYSGKSTEKGALSSLVLSKLHVVMTKTGLPSLEKEVSIINTLDEIVVNFPAVDVGTWSLTVAVIDVDGHEVFTGKTVVNIDASDANMVTVDLDAVLGSLFVEVIIPAGTPITNGKVLLDTPSGLSRSAELQLLNGKGTVTVSNLEPTTWRVKVILKDGSGTIVYSSESLIDILPDVTRSIKLADSERQVNTTCIIAAVGDYPGYSSDLAGPIYDAANMQKLLNSGSQLAVAPKVLIDSQATKAAIKDAILDFAHNSKQEDQLIFYFSGHGGNPGTTDGEDEYVVPYDAIDAGGNGVFRNLITDDELQSWLAPSKSQNVLFIFDTCMSGGMVKGSTKFRLATPTKLARDLNQAGYTVMMACDKDEYSLDYPDGGLYTRSLVYAIESRNADRDRDHIIRPEELHDYVAPLVASQSSQQQHPQIYKGSAAQEISIYRYN